jgi:NADPH2:quinone reductase
MRQTGPPEVLVLEEVTLPPLMPGEVLLRTRASAINHTDLEIRAGNWPIQREPKFPYVPGVEVVGDVVATGPGLHGLKVGELAWTMMQGLGGVRAERDGGYAEHVTVTADAVAPLPRDLDPVDLAAVGLAGVTAYEALAKLEPLRDRTLIVTGAQGGVGSVAVALGTSRGARVVAIERGSSPPEPGSTDAVLDTVAGPLFRNLVQSLRRGGRYCLVGAVAGGDVEFDAWDLVGGLTLTGYSTEDLDSNGFRAATRALLEVGLPSVPRTVMKLDEAARAHALLERREVKGRVILVP